jgi:L-alanine-DL-glutamate epimerase-like enolase superfamily enzyme
MEFRSFANKRLSTFTIATGTSDVMENVLVKIVSGDDFGVGAASPSNVTQETVKSIEEFLAKVPKKIIGTDENDLGALHTRLDSIALGNTAAKAAVDIAIFDLLSKREKKPLHEFLGGSGRTRMLTDMTIGIETAEVAVKKAANYCRQGFKALKIKVGLSLEEDIRRVAAVRDTVGPSIELRVDANQGYSVEQAIRFVGEMATLGVALVEQPVKAEDLDGLKKVTENSEVAIMADECVKSVLDARRVARAEAADMINIKLMKSAGLYDAAMINRLAEAAEMPTMVGCMGELQVSIAAGLHFALSSENVKFADLDSHLNVAHDPSSGLVLRDGYLVAPKKPGLGVRTPLDAPSQ